MLIVSSQLDPRILIGVLIASAILLRVAFSVSKRAGSLSLSDAAAAFALEIAKKVKGERFLAQIILDERYASWLQRERDQQVSFGFKAAGLGTWTWMRDSGKVIGDAQLNVLYGLPPTDTTLHSDIFFERIHPDDSARVREAIQQAFDGGSAYKTEFRVMHPDGTIHWLGARAAVLLDPTGKATGMTGINIDIDKIKSAQQSLADSEQRFRTLADTIPQLAWTADSASFRSWYNRRWCDYTGVSLHRMASLDWQTLIHPDDLPSVVEKWEACTQSGAALSMEFRLLSAEGQYRWFLELATPVKDLSGSVISWFGTDTDITEIRESRDLLRESEKQFRQIADGMPQMVWVTRPDGSVEWRNEQWHTYTGTTPGETGEERPDESYHPDDLPKTRDAWRESLRTGLPFEVENQIRRHDGEYRWFLGRGMPVRDSDGAIVKWFGTCTDIDDYKKAEAEIRSLYDDLAQRVTTRTAELSEATQDLASTQSKLQAVLDSATRVAIIACDPERVITIFNRGAERMLQYRAEEVVGIHTTDLIHSEVEIRRRAEMLTSELNRPISTSDVFRQPAQLGVFDESEWTYIRKDKSTLEVTLAVSAIRNADGAVTGYLGIAIDITAQKSLERALRENNAKLASQTKRAEEANIAKSAFLAAMSHEIRTPMNAILGMSDLLWESQLDSEQRQYVEVFRRAGNVLLDLINSVLDLSKIEAGHLELESTFFDLEDVVTRTVELLSPKAQDKAIQLFFQIAPTVQTKLMGDAVRLQQILVNLVGNAVKFTESGEVLLHVKQHPEGGPGCLDFSISDTGIGISPEQLDSIFEDFSQADASTTRRYGGTGLGLGISQRLITSMGGQLQVTSQPGVGSVFFFTIDLAPGVDRRQSPRNEIKDLLGVRILVVDNNSTNRLILRETLTSWGLISRECASAEEGAAELLRGLREDAPYALVLMDRQMPRVDGFEAIPLLRLADPHIPIVMLTSDNRAGDAAKRARYRLSGYAIRPVKRADLLQLIYNALGTPRQSPAESPNESIGHPTAATPILRILIAEDSPDNRFLLKAYLRSTGHLLTFVENGQIALERFQADSFDLILMDVQMPVMDGLEASRAIRAYEIVNHQTPVPIIAITANALAHDAEASYQAGCNAHLSKPISKQKLFHAIEQYGHAGAPHSVSGPIWVEAPDGLEEFVPEYLNSRQNEYPLLLTYLASLDFETIRKKAHDLKGAGTSFGFLEITRLGAAIERSAKAENAQEITSQLQELGDYLNRVRIAPLQSHTSPSGFAFQIYFDEATDLAYIGSSGDRLAMSRYFAEFIGTFVLVFGGCGAAVLAGDKIGFLGVSFAFGLSLLAMVYTIGHISGCHINPAVTLGLFLSKKFESKHLLGYWIAQILGGLVGAACLLVIAKGGPNGYDPSALGFASNGFGAHSPGGYSLAAAALTEIVLTFFLVLTVIGATDVKAPVGLAGVPIGLVLVLIHLIGIPITNTSVNPARSIGPALFVGGWAVQQLWLFIVAPLAGAAIAAGVYRGIGVPLLTAREAERALPTQQQERLKNRTTNP